MSTPDFLRSLAFDRVLLLPGDEDAPPSADLLEPLTPAQRDAVIRMAIRRLAFQVLYELDMGGQRGPTWARDTLSRVEGLGPIDADRVSAFALAAYDARAAADAEFQELAPEWPSHRLAAVDRAILRLSHFEMSANPATSKIVVSEAVELAKHFSTEKSPAFINALLDRVLHRLTPSEAGSD